MRHLLWPTLLASFVVACAPLPPPAPLTDDPEVNTFIDRIESALQAHAWQQIIALADPAHYRTQVVEHGMPESQYVAELFGLHRVGNDISRNERPAWSDLERIRSASIEEAERVGSEHLVRGTVQLEDGSSLELEARVAEVHGRLALTGGVG